MKTVEKLTVAGLITFLQEQPQDALVAYRLHSEQCLMELSDISVVEACAPRPDGWIQNGRPDMAAQTYLLFPGN